MLMIGRCRHRGRSIVVAPLHGRWTSRCAILLVVVALLMVAGWSRIVAGRLTVVLLLLLSLGHVVR